MTADWGNTSVTQQVIDGRTEQNVLVDDRGEEKRREELARERKEVGRCWNEHKVLFGAPGCKREAPCESRKRGLEEKHEARVG